MRALLGMLAALITALLVWLLWLEPAAAAPQSGTADEPPGGIAEAAAPLVADPAGDESGEPLPEPGRRVVDAPTGWTVHGQVHRGYVEPFAGAKVVAEWFDGFDPSGTVRLTAPAHADETGRFSLLLPLPARATTLRVRSEVPGAKQAEATLLALPGRRLPDEVELHCYPIDAELSGRVVDDAHRPIRGARVSLRSFPPDQITGEDGTFRSRVSSAAVQLTVHAAAPGFALVRQVVPAPKPGATAETEIVLRPGATLRGRVVDEQGEPVEGAKVQTFFTMYYGSVTSGADGAFVLDYLENGRTTDSIHARKPGYVRGRVDYDLRRPEPSYEILLRRGVRVTGTVFDAAGAPLPGAKLYIGSSPSAYERLDAFAREGGRFAFEPVAPGQHDLVTEHPGCAYDVRRIVVPGDVEAHELTVHLQPGHAIGGVAVDASGKPLEGVGVHAREPGVGNGRYIGESTRSDSAGRFQIGDMPGPAVDLEFYGRDVIRHVASGLAVGRDDHRIALQRPARLAGKVVDARSGEPIRQFRVRFLHAGGGGFSATWVREGREYRANDGIWISDSDQLQPGATFRVEVAAKGYGRAVREMTAVVDPEPNGTLFSLTSGQIVRGRVLAAETGLPLARARVAMFDAHQPLQPHNSEDFHGRITDTSDADGAFELEDVPIGTVSLVVDCEGRPRATDGPFEVSVHGPSERLIQLPAAGRIHGTVIDVGGRPLPGARIRIGRIAPKDGYGSDGQQVTADSAGRFATTLALPPGVYSISFSAPIATPQEPIVVGELVHELAGGAADEVQLRPSGTGRLRVQLRRSDGTAWTGAFVVVLVPIDGSDQPLPRRPLRVIQVPGSGAEILGLAPGRYRVTLSAMSGGAHASVEIAATGTTNADLQLGSAR